MTYSNTPNTGDTLGSTRVPINTNFSLIQAGISQDHNGLGTGAGVAGKHTVIHLAEQATEGQTTATESALYTKSGGNGDIFARSPNHVDVLPNGEYQLTTFNDASIASFGNSVVAGFETSGWTFLPGGLIMQYGSLSSLITGTFTINIPISLTTTTFKPIITIGLMNFRGYIKTQIFPVSMTSFDFIVTDLMTTGLGSSGIVYWTILGKT